MEATGVGLGFVEFLLLFCTQFLGSVPGERDPLLIKSPPAAAYAYCEWTAFGEPVPGAAGLSGWLADEEIQHFLQAFEKSLEQQEHHHAHWLPELDAETRTKLMALVRLTMKHAGCLYLSGDFGPQDEVPMIPVEGAIVLNLGDDLPEFLTALNHVFRQLPNYEPNPRPVDHPVPIPLLSAVLHQDGTRLIFAWGAGARTRLAERWQAKESQLAQSAVFADIWRQQRIEKPGSLTWLNLQIARQDLEKKLGPVGLVASSIVQSLGIGEVSSLLTVSGSEQGDDVTRTQLVLSGEPRGLLQLFNGQPIAPAAFAAIPADADFVSVTTLDLHAVHQSLRGIVSQAAPEALNGFDEFQRQLEQELQLKLDDVILAFGPVITTYDSPASGGVGLTGLVLALPVRDAGRADKVFQRIRQLLVESLPPGTEDGGTTLKEFPFAGETIHFFNSTGFMVRYDGSPPFSPALCLTKDQLLFSLHPQALKGHLRFLGSQEPRSKKYAALQGPEDQGDLLSVISINTPQIAAAIYPFVPLLAKPLLAGGQTVNSEFHLGVIPSARSVLPALRESSLVVRRKPQTLIVEQRNMLPVWLSLLMLPQLAGSHGMMMEHEMMFEGKKGAPVGAPVVNLGNADGVQPAKAEVPAAPEAREPSVFEKAARRTLPFLLRDVIPDEVELFIPSSVFEKLAQPPDPEEQARRAADRERRRQERAARRAARKVK